MKEHIELEQIQPADIRQEVLKSLRRSLGTEC